MELKDTIKIMTSEEYKERFKAEVYQLDIRIGKLVCNHVGVSLKYNRSSICKFSRGSSLADKNVIKLVAQAEKTALASIFF